MASVSAKAYVRTVTVGDTSRPDTFDPDSTQPDDGPVHVRMRVRIRGEA